MSGAACVARGVRSSYAARVAPRPPNVMRLLFVPVLLFVVACTDDPVGDPVDDTGADASGDVAADGVDVDTGTDVADRDGDSLSDIDAGAPDGSGDGSSDGSGDVVVEPFPAPNAWGPREGPGVPAVAFTDEQLGVNCATLDGGDEDVSDHHNMLTIYNGWLLMPWAPEFARGGLTFYDLSDPCAPTVHGTGFSPTMRETHAIGFADRGDRRWAVVNSVSGFNVGGIEFWDVTDTSAPFPVATFETPDFFYPDAYARVTLSVFWQDPWVYVGGAGNGVFIIDATDPETPVLVNQYVPEPVYRVGQVQAVGSMLVLTGAEVARTTVLDVSDPRTPRLVSDFVVEDSGGEVRDPYFTNLRWPHVFYANKDGGGGLLVYDIDDPTAPELVGENISDGNGGYVMLHEDYAFVGESRFAAQYDLRELPAIPEVRRFDLEGDLDTATPIGHLLMLSVDDDALANEGTAIAPWDTAPDSRGPAVTGSVPADGATDVALTSPLGISMTELVDPASVFAGSVRLFRSDQEPDAGRVEAWITSQEQLISIVPKASLDPLTEYTLLLPVDGVIDASGNDMEAEWRIQFTTAASE